MITRDDRRRSNHGLMGKLDGAVVALLLLAMAASADDMAWTNLGGGVDAGATALAYDGTNLFAGGLFSTAGFQGANRVARWNGSVWTALGDGTGGGLAGDVGGRPGLDVDVDDDGAGGAGGGPHL